MVYTLKNQYRGINAHLHSRWQGESGWGGFHTAQIGDLMKTLKTRLLLMGYTCDTESSLQIRRAHDDIIRPRADVLISDRRSQRTSPTAASASPTQMTVIELLNADELSEKPYRAVVIYEREQNTVRRGRPVAWIELLSPANKGTGDDAEAYRAKRINVIASGLVFVELDYLHETPPTFHTIPNYCAGDTGSHAYRIIVIDPRPDFEHGPVTIAGFDADMAFPIVNIPLNAGDVLTFDFGIPYRKTYEEAAYGLELVDYSQLPLNFEHYSPADQTRIVARMLAVLNATPEQLDNPPLPTPDITLEQGLHQLAELTHA